MVKPTYCLVLKEALIRYYSYIVFPIYPPANETEICNLMFEVYGNISLTEEPALYWNLTDPDPCILEALQNPGHWTELFDYENSTFWRIAWWNYGTLDLQNPIMHGIHRMPFKYNGTYYFYDMLEPSFMYRVNPLNEEPEDYYNFTSVPWYLQEAIDNPGKMITQSVEFYHEIWRFLRHMENPFKYNGSYYELDLFDVLQLLPEDLNHAMWPRTEYTVAGATGLAFSGIALLCIRKKRKNINSHLI
jgi:hypothetical protein